MRGLVALVATMLCLTAVALVQQGPDQRDITTVAYTPPRVSPFLDVPGTNTGSPHAFYGEIAWLSERGISTGYQTPTGRTFDPAAPVLREQMAAFLYRLAGEPEVQLPARSPFADVDPSHPFYRHIVWLASTGVTTGYPAADGTAVFRGGQPVLREQMAAFMYRFQTWKDDGERPAVDLLAPAPFTDVGAGASFSREIRWLAQSDVTTGYVEPGGGATFRPAQPVLREQMAAFMFRFDSLDGPAPVVTRLSSATSPLNGGATIAIHGKNFTPGASTYVSFGNTRATSTISSPFLMSVVVPRSTTPGVVKLTVTTPDGTSEGLDFEYVVPGGASPVVTAVSPSQGPTAGGTTVTLEGAGLKGVATVMFGSVPAASVTEFDGTFVRAVSPASASSGPVTVSVTTAGGTYQGPTFTYTSPPPTGPVAGTPIPRWGSTAGGTSVTINGERLGDVVSVKFGAAEATSFVVVSPTVITAVTPPRTAAGSATVTLTTATGSSTSASSFSYTEVSGPPVVTSMTPDSGGLDGLTAVDLAGTDLVDVVDVTVGGKQAAYSIVSPTKLTVTPPPSAEEATVPVVVTTRLGSTTVAPGFTYELPEVTPEPGPPSIATTSLTSATAGESYVHQLLTSDHRAGTWGVSAGALPPGVSIDGDRIRGVPTRPGTHPVTLTFTDEAGRSATASLALFVGVPGSEPGVSEGTTSLVDGPAAGSVTAGQPRDPSVSADGRFVVYSSLASDLVLADPNGVRDVFVRDLVTGTTDVVSSSSAGLPGNGEAASPVISSDGRYVAFTSSATNLVADDTNQRKDVFVHDRLTRSTERVSSGSSGQSDGDSGTSTVSISSDGRYVAFGSLATNLVPGRTIDAGQVYRHDRLDGTTTIVSATVSGTPGRGLSGTRGQTAMSADGRYVAYLTSSADLAYTAPGFGLQVVVRDMATGVNQTVSSGQRDHAVYPSAYGNLSISADGRHIAFDSYTSLLPGDGNQDVDVYVFDRLATTTTLVSFDTSGRAVSGSGGSAPSMSADGRFVAFSGSGRLAWGAGTTPQSHAYVHDLTTGRTEIVSVSSAGAVGDRLSESPAISGDGSRVVMVSLAQNLGVGPVTPGRSYVYLHDRGAP